MTSLYAALALVLSTLIFPADVSAQVDGHATVQTILEGRLGTISVNSLPQFADGKLVSCGIEFTALAQDWMYKRGGFIRVGGQFGLMSVGAKTAAVLKVIVYDVDTKTLTSTPSPPITSHMISSSTLQSNRTSLVAYNPSDTPGALFGIFELMPSVEIMMDAVQTNKITVAFNRKEKGMDVQVPLDLQVESTHEDGRKTRSDRATAEFLKCSVQLLRQ
jgi:hypothetical protein